MNGPLFEWVTCQAERTPDVAAVVATGQCLSYAALDVESSRLANALRAAGVRRHDRVALLLPKCPRAFVAILAAQKAGAAYVPLDPDNPATRLATMVESAQPAAIVIDASTAPRCAELWARLPDRPPALVWADDAAPNTAPVPPAVTWRDLTTFSANVPEMARADDDPVYVMFTSGSTGTPKGVVITHANVRSFVQWAVCHFGIAAGERLSAHAPLHFDLSTLDMYGAFAAGATLVPVASHLNLFPERLAGFIRGAELTQWFSAPSILNYMAAFDVVRHRDFPSLRRVLWCGEVFPTPGVIYWMTRVPHAQFTNLYGPTETTVASSYHTLPACPEDPQAAIPIGRACGSERLLVLDDALRPCPARAVGELYIGGPGLSPGYWRDPEKTRAAFVPDPTLEGERLYRTGDLAYRDEAGRCFFMGREDTQIKARGHRIELGEIETAVHADPTVHECALVAVPSDGFDGQSICCAYALVPGTLATEDDLRNRLATRVPKYMVPSRWRQFERLPKNANGKIDRHSLREVFATDAAHAH